MASSTRITLATATLVCLVAGAARANLLTNGDFESGNTGFGSDYTHSPGDITDPAVYDVLQDPSTAHSSAASYGDHTTGSGLMMAINGDTSTVGVAWRETVAVNPGVDYTFAMWISSWSGGGTLQLQINGSDVGSSITSPSTEGVWESAERAWSAGAATSAELELVNLSSEYSGNDFAIDDLTFVPEPASLMLWGAFGLTAGRRRRRRNTRA